MKFRYKTTKNGMIPFDVKPDGGGVSNKKKRKRKQQKLSRKLNRTI